jgi:hypothetical protein
MTMGASAFFEATPPLKSPAPQVNADPKPHVTANASGLIIIAPAPHIVYFACRVEAHSNGRRE